MNVAGMQEAAANTKENQMVLGAALQNTPRWLRVLQSAWLWRGVDVVLFLLLMLQAACYFTDIGEDAYINLRYVRNLLRGDGLVYNPGEYVEGFSNPLWTLLLAGLAAMGFTFTLSLNILFFTFTVASFLVLRSMLIAIFGANSGMARIPLILMACASALTASYGNGLEGSAVGLSVVLLMTGCALHRPAWLLLGGAMMLLNRPEGIVFAALAGIWLAYSCHTGHCAWKTFRQVTFLWGALLLILTTLRLWYYGDLLPNTVYAKSSAFEHPDFFHNAIQYFGAYFRYVGFPIVVLAAGAFFNQSRRPVVSFYWALVAANWAVVFLNGGDWMQHFRLFMPFFATLAVLAMIAVEASHVRSRQLCLILTIICILSAWHMFDRRAFMERIPRILERWRMARNEPETVRFPLCGSISFQDIAEANDKVVVESGGFPAFLLDHVHVVEMNGLTDREIAKAKNPYRYRRPATGVINWIEVFKKEPTYFIFNALSSFYWINDIAKVPGASNELQRFMVAQCSSFAPDVSPWNIILLRSDAPALPSLLPVFGAFAPATDFISQEFASYYFYPVYDPAKDIYHNERLMTEWEAMPWGDDSGGLYPVEWQRWESGERLSAAISVPPGKSAIGKPLRDDSPILVLVGICPETDPGVRIDFSLSGGDTSDESLGVCDARGQDSTHCATWVTPLAVVGGGGRRLVIAFDADAGGSVMIAAHRWCDASLPDFPKVIRPAMP